MFKLIEANKLAEPVNTTVFSSLSAAVHVSSRVKVLSRATNQLQAKGLNSQAGAMSGNIKLFCRDE